MYFVENLIMNMSSSKQQPVSKRMNYTNLSLIRMRERESRKRKTRHMDKIGITITLLRFNLSRFLF